MTPRFETKRLPIEADAIAPDGSEVRLLSGLRGGGLAHFRLAPGAVSTAVAHRTVEELWFFLSGQGQMWRQLGGRAEVVEVERNMSISIPVGTRFQFRSSGDEPLEAIGVTMPPWPGDDEAYVVEGVWDPTVPKRHS